MKNYNSPKCEIVVLACEDVVTASGFGNTTEWVDE